MEIVGLDRSKLHHEYGLDTHRLLPWPALNAPFEGAWCVVPAGTASTAHSHHEHEIFVAVDGAALVECDGEQAAFGAGDVVFFAPGQVHRVLNDGDATFEFYSVWWDRATTERFVAREDSATAQARAEA
jgi:mannose-6-phosphate isomerase-like protein (cupin superfamily)